MWNRIVQVVAAAVRVGAAGAEPRPRSFQVLGVDLDLDETLQPWFLEANVTPFLGYQADFEQRDKERLLSHIADLVFVNHTHAEWERVI